MAADDEEQSRTLFVGNLSSDVTNDLLEELFLQAGPLEQVKLVTPKGEQQRNRPPFAFVVFKHLESVLYSANLFKHITLFGRDLSMRTQQAEQAAARLSAHKRTLSCPSSLNDMAAAVTGSGYPIPQTEDTLRNQRQNEKRRSNDIHRSYSVAGSSGSGFRKRPFGTQDSRETQSKQARQYNFLDNAARSGGNSLPVRGEPGNFYTLNSSGHRRSSDQQSNGGGSRDGNFRSNQHQHHRHQDGGKHQHNSLGGFQYNSGSGGSSGSAYHQSSSFQREFDNRSSFPQTLQFNNNQRNSRNSFDGRKSRPFKRQR